METVKTVGNQMSKASILIWLLEKNSLTVDKIFFQAPVKNILISFKSGQKQ